MVWVSVPPVQRDDDQPSTTLREDATHRLKGVLGRLFERRRSPASAQQPARAEFLRRQGDSARDMMRWSEAVAAYEGYLRVQPADSAIWVQLGNCAKEAGDLEASLRAYEAAARLHASDPDIHLQKGHLFKKMGRLTLARKAFRTSIDLMPEANPAYEELMALQRTERGRSRIARRSAAPSIYIDVTDILDYLKVNLSLSGIQRVVANLVQFASEFEENASDCVVRAAFPDYNEQVVYEVNLDAMQALVDAVAIRSGRDVVDRALEEVRESRVPVTLSDRDTLLIPGAFWIYQRYDLLSRLRQEGARVAVFIHDLIQITNPEFVEPAATVVFCRSFADVLCVSSYLLSNSEHVANEIRDHMRDRMNFAIPVFPVTLATELGTRALTTAPVSADIAEVLKDDFVLYVSTIEVRKNHLYLVKIWERLIASGAAWIPNLVFVGKWGWEIDELREHLNASDYLGARLFIFNGISDHELAALYEHCAFTVYPSFAEGWGLPVGESLGYGKPCVVSRVTSLPEVGGAFCRYIDPFDADDGFRVISDVLADRPALEAWQARVKHEFRSKTWRDFTGELLGVVQRLAREPAFDHRGSNVVVERDQLVTFGNDPLEQLDSRRALLVTARMTRLSGWHGLETWGCWAAKRRAQLAFQTRVDPGTDILLYLFLQAPAGDLAAECSIRCEGLMTTIVGLGPQPRWFTAKGRVTDEGAVHVTIVSGRGFHHRNGRELFVGLIAIGFCVLDDRIGRERLLDSIVPGGLMSAS